jgi:hypothetical protein
MLIADTQRILHKKVREPVGELPAQSWLGQERAQCGWGVVILVGHELGEQAAGHSDESEHA